MLHLHDAHYMKVSKQRKAHQATADARRTLRLQTVVAENIRHV